MAYKIYHFDVVSEVARSGTNVIHHATDPLDGSTVYLCEWNPPNLEAATATLAEAKASVSHGEAFSSGRHLYLASPPNSLAEGLVALRARGLFQGSWPTILADESPNPNRDEPEQTTNHASNGPSATGDVPQQLEESRESRGGSTEQDQVASVARPTSSALPLGLAIALGFLAVVLGVQLSSANSARNAAESRASSNAARVSELDSELSKLKAERDRLNNDLQTARNQLAVYTTRKRRDIVIDNTCGAEVKLAIRYLNASGNWTTMGWWMYPANQRTYLADFANMRLSTSEGFYFYAEATGNSGWKWEGSNTYVFDGRSLGMRLASDTNADGEYSLRLTCP